MANNLIKMGKHKKWVALLGYSGHGYYGMQRQTCGNKNIDHLPTIESELLKSFHQAGLINENEFNNPSVMHFQRAARTDKGVSAVKQIISLNIANDFSQSLPKINDSLPPHIRVFSVKRATKYFDSKNFCDARTYSYLLPSFALCPIDQITNETYSLTSEILEEFNSLLEMFTGSHNFHNFTAGKKPTDPSSRRYIISFKCSDSFMLGNETKKLQFLVARVKGQSFMLHQIRKMIGLAIAVMRGLVDRSAITRAFGNERLDVPMAPGLGLLLEEVHYERYNKKYGGDGVHEPLLWDEMNDQISIFKNEYIYPKIVQIEIEEKSMFNWLATLPIHTFDVRDNPNNVPLEIIKPFVKAHFNANKIDEAGEANEGIKTISDKKSSITSETSNDRLQQQTTAIKTKINDEKDDDGDQSISKKIKLDSEN